MLGSYSRNAFRHVLQVSEGKTSNLGGFLSQHRCGKRAHLGVLARLSLNSHSSSETEMQALSKL